MIKTTVYSFTSTTPRQNKVAIIGGGLAGLSVAYHLLEKSSTQQITIFDSMPGPGEGGASSVAGGLLHPLSPRGKLVFKGREGMASSNRLIDISSQHEPRTILRDCIYRPAQTEKQWMELKETARAFPEYATLLTAEQMRTALYSSSGGIDNFSSSSSLLGGLLLSNGCKVIHVPSYLKGLWKASLQFSDHDVSWKQCHVTTPMMKEIRENFDTIVLAAGAGLFQESLVLEEEYPISLVRGQSLEFILPPKYKETPIPAVLRGKYVSPLPSPDGVMIGSTYEYDLEDAPLSKQNLMQYFKERTYDLNPMVWDEGTISKVTIGCRVRTHRSSNGRLPLFRRLDDKRNNIWLFTGLGSRGILYHGVYGKILSEAIYFQNNP